MANYEIGTRLKGYSRDYLKALTCEISKKFDMGNLTKRIVPHLTFLRPFATNSEQELIEVFEEILSKYNEPINYTLEGFGTFENEEKVVYGKIKSNFQIENIINDLEKSLEKNIRFLNSRIRLPQEKNKINLHSSIISKGANKYFSEIKDFLKKQNFREMTHALLRVYLLRDKIILREFDFYLNENLERWDAINPFVFQETKKAFTKKTNLKITEEGLLLPLPKSFH